MRWLVAMQAQDYAGAKWAIGIRLPGSRDAEIETAFNRGEILRTHVLRPTWHFVAPADIRWLLALTAPRVHVANAHLYRKLDLDAATFRRSDSVLARALEGGRHLTRDELRAVLVRRRIATNDVRMTFLVMHAELEGLICSGPRRGKKFTYALLEERVRPARPISREEALGLLARRFVASRNPATAQDLAKWSGLTVAEARRGLESVRSKTEQRGPRRAAPVAHLLSVYDELFSSYRDGSATIAAGHALRRSGVGESGLSVITINGAVVGRWQRALVGGSSVPMKLFRRITPAERRALAAAVERYRAFVAGH